MEPYVIKHLRATLKRIKEEKHGNWLIYTIRNQLPYVLEVEDDIVKPINREYKPLCIISCGEAVDYKTVTLYDVNIKDIKASNIKLEQSHPLYTDATAPWINKTNLKNYIITLDNIYGGLKDLV